jgi:hypothetical protein
MAVINIRKGTHVGASLKKAFEEFKTQTIDEEVRREMQLICQNIVYKAINNRRNAPGKHDFTGNLLNSIVAVLYKDKELIYYYTSAGSLRYPRYYEMTASHRHGHYHFNIDYEGKTSDYTADVETFRRKAMDDVNEFMSLYTPDRMGFVMVVAYAVDYAEWVEMARSTTGYVQTLHDAEKMFRGKRLKMVAYSTN